LAPSPGKNPGGIWPTTLIGEVGSFVATYPGQLTGCYKADQ